MSFLSKHSYGNSKRILKGNVFLFEQFEINKRCAIYQTRTPLAIAWFALSNKKNKTTISHFHVTTLRTKAQLKNSSKLLKSNTFFSLQWKQHNHFWHGHQKDFSREGVGKFIGVDKIFTDFPQKKSVALKTHAKTTK